MERDVSKIMKDIIHSMLLDQLRMAFVRDDLFTMDVEAIFDKKNRNVIWFGVGKGYSIDDIDKFNNDSNYIIIPGISHEEWHNVFYDFLKSINKSDEYTRPGIGFSFKQMGQVDKYLWFEYKSNYAENKAKVFLNDNIPTLPI
jgi:hypothetical protein